MNYSAPSTYAPKQREGQQEFTNLVKVVIYLLFVSCYISLLWNLEYLREKYCSTCFPRPCRFRYRGRRGGRGHSARRRRSRRRHKKRKSKKTHDKSTAPIHEMREKGKICTICQIEIELNSKCKEVPKCKHVFHADCIDKWLKVGTKCPNCRTSFETGVSCV